jgi:hypothetical protein
VFGLSWRSSQPAVAGVMSQAAVAEITGNLSGCL